MKDTINWKDHFSCHKANIEDMWNAFKNKLTEAVQKNIHIKTIPLNIMETTSPGGQKNQRGHQEKTQMLATIHGNKRPRESIANIQDKGTKYAP